MKIIAGNSNPILANKVSEYLNQSLTNTNVGKFKDGEISIEIKESIRGRDVFIFQSTSNPTNDNLMELLIIIDALKRGSAKRITAVIPYFGYARQDRKNNSRAPISAKLVANLIETAGADRVLSVDLHATQIQGFFDIPVDNLFANGIFLEDIKSKHPNPENLIVVSPDVGGVARARSTAKLLGCEIAIIDKRRPVAGVSEVMNIIGDVKGKECILIDDIADSAGTLCNASEALLRNGTTNVSAYVTHGVFSDNAIERIEESAINDFVCTDTILLKNPPKVGSKIRYMSIASLLAKAIDHIHDEKSLSELFIK